MQKTFTKNHSYMAKGLAILLLLAYHLFENETLVTTLKVNYGPFSLSTFLTMTGFGNICVAIFVFLTSYGISVGLYQQIEKSISSAYKQAVKRFFILMIHFGILFLSVNLLWWHFFDYQGLYGINKQGFLYFLTDASGLSMFFDTPTLNETWWYMEIAYLLIFLVPFLAMLTQKLRYSMLFLAFFVPYMITLNSDLNRYLFVAVLGVVVAHEKWLDQLMNLKIPMFLQYLIGIVGFILCIIIRQNHVVYTTYVHIVDGFVALFLVWFQATLIGSIPYLSKVFTFLGKHAMNIYLIHTFFYMSLWRKYIYHFQYAWATFLLLLVVCLVYSILLEFFKKITGLKKALARYHG